MLKKKDKKPHKKKQTGDPIRESPLSQNTLSKHPPTAHRAGPPEAHSASARTPPEAHEEYVGRAPSTAVGAPPEWH